MARITPFMSARGLFSVKEPFRVSQDTEYTVSAIRSFEEIRAQGQSPLALIYIPVGLGEEAYQSDINNGATIVTLTSANEKPKYIPDTYLLSVPSAGNVPYSWLIASVSLGPMPDSYDTALLEEKLKGVVSDFIGVEATVNIGRAPTEGVITPEQHEAITRRRQAAIKTRETDRALALKNAELLKVQQERIEILEETLVSLSQSA